AAARRFKCVGILGTRFLMEGPVYRSKLSHHGIRCEIPEAKQREGINDIIFGELVYGRFEDGARQYFRHVILQLDKRGCDAVVVGCTEIPLLISADDSPLAVLASAPTLARAAPSLPTLASPGS